MHLLKNPPVEKNTSPPPSHRSFFGRTRSPVVEDHGNNGVDRKGSIFSRRRRSNSTQSDAVSESENSHSGFFGGTRSHTSEDPTILAAREKVASAVGLEKGADQALIQARMAVKEAREHVKILEREAALDAKRAKEKKLATEDISKHARGLGRHG